MNEYKLFGKRIGMIGLVNILISLSSFIFLPILTKNLSTADYGIWIQINITILLLSNLANIGLPYTMNRFLASAQELIDFQERFYTIAILAVIASFFISFLFFLLIKTIGGFLFNGNTVTVLILAIIIFLTSLNNLFLIFFNAIQKIKKYSILQFIQTYLTVLIVSYFILSGFNIFGALIGLLITQLIVFSLVSFLIFLEIGYSKPQLNNLKEYLYFGIPTIPSSISFQIVDSSDRYFISFFLGAAFVGYYSPGYTIGTILLFFIAPFSTLLPAALPKYYDEKRHDDVKRLLNNSIKYFLMFAIPTAVGLSLLSKSLLMILTTPEIALEGYFITPFTAFTSILSGIYVIYIQILLLVKKTNIMGTLWAFAALINVILNLVLIPRYGILGAAFSTVIAYSFTLIITIFFTKNYFQVDFDISFSIKCIVSSAVMAIILFYLNPKGILDIIIAIAICTIVYFITLFITQGIKKEEFNILKNILN